MFFLPSCILFYSFLVLSFFSFFFDYLTLHFVFYLSFRSQCLSLNYFLVFSFFSFFFDDLTLHLFFCLSFLFSFVFYFFSLLSFIVLFYFIGHFLVLLYVLSSMYLNIHPSFLLILIQFFPFPSSSLAPFHPLSLPPSRPLRLSSFLPSYSIYRFLLPPCLSKSSTSGQTHIRCWIAYFCCSFSSTVLIGFCSS